MSGHTATPACLPCPFDGADATAKMYGRDMLFKVECNGCGAEMRGFDQCQQDAIDAWNTRTNSHAELVKALEAASGFLLNAKIDLQTGANKGTAIATIDGGLKMIRDALATLTARKVG